MIIRGRHYLTGDLCEVRIANGLIESITPTSLVQTIAGGRVYQVSK